MLTHVKLSCCHEGCYAVITLHPDDERRLRRTRESFYCPAGHSQHFTDKTAEEKKIEELEGEIKKLESSVGFHKRRRNQVTDQLELTCRALGVCPLGCGWTSRKRIRRASLADGWSWNLHQYLDRVGRDLNDHLRAEHNATPAKVRLLGPGSGSDEDVLTGEVVE